MRARIALASLVVALLAAPALDAGEERKPVTRRSLLIGTDDGLWRVEGDLEDDKAWTKTALLHRPKKSVRSILRTKAGVLYVGFGMRGAGLYASRDDGKTWTAVKGWPETRQVWGLSVSPAGGLWVGSQPADVWQGDPAKGKWTPNPSLKEIPEREKWTFIRPPYRAHLLGFAAHADDPDRYLAAVEQGGVLETTDKGRTWRQISPLWDVHVVLYGKESAVAATGAGLFRRSKGAWSDAILPGYATGLCRDRSGVLYAAMRGATAALWQSKDDGKSWKPLKCAVTEPGHGVHALAADPRIAGSIYHGAGRSIWVVRNGEATELARGLPVVRRVWVEVPK